MVPNIGQFSYIGNIVSGFEIPDMILALLYGDSGSILPIWPILPIWTILILKTIGQYRYREILNCVLLLWDW